MNVVLKLVPFAFLCLLIATLGFVLRRGGWVERSCAITIVIGSVLSAVAAHHVGMWRSPESGIFIVDVIVLGAFIGIMAFSNRFWPLWITALQIVAVATHIARIVQSKTIPIAYAIAEQLWAYPMLVIIVASIMLDRQRRSTR